MKTTGIAALAVAVVGAFSATPAHAVLQSRYLVQMAAGHCQPFFSTTQARYSAGGLRNGGTAQFYVVCSMAGTWKNSSDGGATIAGIIVNNPTGSDLSMACTARPGYIVGTISSQAASPKSATVEAGTHHAFYWVAADFGTTAIRNINFTCTLKPGMEIQYTEYNYQVDVGA